MAQFSALMRAVLTQGFPSLRHFNQANAVIQSVQKVSIHYKAKHLLTFTFIYKKVLEMMPSNF